MTEPTELVPELCESCLQKRREWWARFQPPKLPEHAAVQAAIENLAKMTLGEQIRALADAGLDHIDGSLAEAPDDDTT